MHAFHHKFTDRARKALDLANDYAKTHKHPLVTRLHLLYGILEENQNVATAILTKLGVDPAKLKEQVKRSLGEGTYRTNEVGVPYDVDACRTTVLAIDLGLPVQHIACQHLLKALLMGTTDPAGLILKNAAVTPELFDAQLKASVRNVS